MDKRWYNLYCNDIKRNDGLKNYYYKKIKYRKKLIKKITQYADSKIVLEAGCGTGVFSIKFADMGYDSYAVDIDKNMLTIVQKISKSVSKVSPKMLECDIFELESVIDKLIDVVYSIGVLEHFDDKEISLILEQQSRISKYIFVGVPTKYFSESEKLYGNERFLTYKYWRNLFKSNNFCILEEFDLYNGNLLSRIKNIKKWFKPAPIRVFVIRERNKYEENYNGNRKYRKMENSK